MTIIQASATIPHEFYGKRLDQVLAELFPDYSRSRLQLWLKAGQIKVDDKIKRAKDKVIGGERIIVEAEMIAEPSWQAEDIALTIVYEDDSLLVINKPVGLVVHPGAGNSEGTLLNALLHHIPSLGELPRAGIVHRLDKDTSGLMVVAKTLQSHHSLVDQLQNRSVSREYEAIATGVMTSGFSVDLPIGRHPTQRTKMAVLKEGGKEAITHVRILARYRQYCHLRVKLETGRTHQIRVHLSHRNYPLLGDGVYGKRLVLPKNASEELSEALRGYKHQALHARRLSLLHPVSAERMTWEADIPEDMQAIIELLKQDLKLNPE
ncbi:MAG: 23S rRNA pseudouridine(1911/1915/1917) synthase RluD [Gammaproteobacteria bacterium]|nr:23S rRNA pseudouridine(1911/1915/1917) synthase RluD [Gammaproteobacteria bacterium]